PALPGRARHREIAGRDEADRSDREAGREAHLVRQLGRNRLPEHPSALAGRVFVEVDDLLHVAPALRDDLAHLGRHGPRKVLLLPAKDPCGLEEQLAAPRGRRLLPLVEGFFCLANRLVELVLRGQRECRQGLARRRVVRLEALPVRLPPLAADEEAVLLDHVLAERSKVRPGYDVIVGSATDLRDASTTGSSEYRTMARAASRRPSATTSGDNGRTSAANRFRHAFGPTHAVRHPNARPVSTSEGLSPTIHAPRGRAPRSRAAARSIPGRGFRHAQSDKTLCGQW